MNFLQLQCFLAAADTLHFGRAAQSLNMLPASLGRQIKILEDTLEIRLFERTTRNVALSPAGKAILEDARLLVKNSEKLQEKLRGLQKQEKPLLRLGAIDSAAAGLMPQLLKLIRDELPGVEVQLFEQKTIRLLPKLLSGSLDIAFCRPPDVRDPRLVFRTLFYETAVVALPEDHPLSQLEEIHIEDLEDAPLIVPDRRSRPHSHDLSIKAFTDAGLTARIVQVAEEKHTIVNLVATGTGLAIVPKWTTRISVPGVRFVPFIRDGGSSQSKLLLAAAWVRGTRDPLRDQLLEILERNLNRIAQTA